MRGISLIAAFFVFLLTIPCIARPLPEEPSVTAISGELDLLDPATGNGTILLKVEAESLGQPVLVGKTLYVASSHMVYALDPQTGKEKWQFPSPGSVFGLTASEHHVFVGTGGALVALDPSNGTVLWKYDSDIPVIGPTLVDGAVVFNNLDGPVAVDQQTGKLRWQLSVQWGYFVFSPLSDHRLCVWKPDEVFMIETEHGKTLWQSASDQSVSAPGALPTPAVAGGELICQIHGTPKDAEDWSLYARDAQGGHPVWRTSLGQHDAIGIRTTISGNAVYCVLEDELSAVDLAEGKLKWQATIKPMEAGGAGLISSHGLVLVPELRGELAAMDEKSGKTKWIAGAPKPVEKGQIRVAGICAGDAGIYITRNEQVR